MKVSIIIPCYNEKNTVREIIKKINNTDVLNCEKELIVIDDNSNDGTSIILEEIKNSSEISVLIKNSTNQGKGFSIKEGIKNSSGDIILIQDADLEYDPRDYVKLLEPIIEGYADVVYGSRFLGASRVRVLYFWHSVGNYFLTFAPCCKGGPGATQKPASKRVRASLSRCPRRHTPGFQSQRQCHAVPIHYIAPLGSSACTWCTRRYRNADTAAVTCPTNRWGNSSSIRGRLH